MGLFYLYYHYRKNLNVEESQLMPLEDYMASKDDDLIQMLESMGEYCEVDVDDHIIDTLSAIASSKL
jgi:hypothetical protein